MLRDSMRWKIYMIEAALLGMFMMSACGFGTLLEHPQSPLRQAISDGFARRAIMGAAMGLTALCLIYSPWGKRSGPHMNPAVTLCYLRLGKIAPIDAMMFIVSQFVGGIAGVMVMKLILGAALGAPPVNYVATLPGRWGVSTAWVGEFVISFILLTTVLTINRIPGLVMFTGCFSAMLVAAYITFESPISGMSMNPARTLGSAAVAVNFTALWVYFTAPVLGMLAAVEVQRSFVHPDHLCGKLVHSHKIACIFKCNCLTSNGINDSATHKEDAACQTITT